MPTPRPHPPPAAASRAAPDSPPSSPDVSDESDVDEAQVSLAATAHVRSPRTSSPIAPSRATVDAPRIVLDVATPVTAAAAGSAPARAAHSAHGLSATAELDLECFYCQTRILAADEFVVCTACHGFFACTACWAGVDNDVWWMQSQQAMLLSQDRRRRARGVTRPRWQRLERHLFTDAHAISDTDARIARRGFAVTRWAEYYAALHHRR